MKSEYQIQAEIIVWFRNEYQRKGLGLIFSVPNEATYKSKQFMGVLNGVSDLIVVLHGQVLFCELKNATYVQSSAQKQFESSIISLGHKYFVIRCLNDFKELIFNLKR